jgi:hypothetical protein
MAGLREYLMCCDTSTSRASPPGTRCCLIPNCEEWSSGTAAKMAGPGDIAKLPENYTEMC